MLLLDYVAGFLLTEAAGGEPNLLCSAGVRGEAVALIVFGVRYAGLLNAALMRCSVLRVRPALLLSDQKLFVRENKKPPV